MRPHYYYKIAADTQAGKALREFSDKCREADETAREWAAAHGAANYYESPAGMAGGVAAVDFGDTTIGKDGWERVTAPDGRMLFVPQPDTDLEKEMYALPIVSEVALIGILRFKRRISAKTGKPLPFTFGDATPVVFLHQGYWYADVPYESEAEEAAPISDKEFYRRKMAATNES